MPAYSFIARVLCRKVPPVFERLRTSSLTEADTAHKLLRRAHYKSAVNHFAEKEHSSAAASDNTAYRPPKVTSVSVY